MEVNRKIKIKERLTHKIAEEYIKRVEELPDNGRQDIGVRRELRLELQERCGVTELEAVNILNGRYVTQYVNKYYMLQNNIPLECNPNKNKNLVDLQVLEELERLKMVLHDDFNILDE